MAISITKVTEIQRLVKKFQNMVETEPQVRKFSQQIKKEYDGSHLIPLEALRGLDDKRQQALANLLSDLIDKMLLSQAFTAEEEQRLQEMVRHANSKQQEVNLKRPEEKQVGLNLIESGRCALISLEAFNALDPDRRERLAIFVGREHLQQTLSEKDKRAMENLVQFAHLQQETARIKPNTLPSPMPSVSSSSFFSGTSSLLSPFSAETKKSLDDGRFPQKN